MKKYSILLLLSTMLIILFTDCEKEDINLLDNQESFIAQIQQKFDINAFSDGFYIKDNLEINWNEFSIKNYDNIEFYEFKVTLLSPLMNTSDMFSASPSFSLIAHKIRNEIKVNMVEFRPYDYSNEIISSIFDIVQFSGSIRYFDKDAVLINKETYFQGSLEKSDIIDFLPLPKKPPIGDYSIFKRVEPCDPVRNVIDVYIMTEHYTDYYSVQLSSVDYTTILWISPKPFRSVYTGTSTEHYSYTTYSCETPQTGDEVYKSEYMREQRNIDAEEQITLDESFESIQKVKCTYDRLKETLPVQNLLIRFFGDNAMFNLTFKVKENLICNDNVNAVGCTRATLSYDDKNVEILLDKDFVLSNQTPTLFIAQAIVHEAIHANLILAAKEANGGVPPSNEDFGTVYEAYRQMKNWSHQAMADKYVGLIADALEDVHALLGDEAFINYYNSNSLWDWDEFYRNVAWFGLLENSTTGHQYYQQNSEKISFYKTGAEVNSTKSPKCNNN